MGQLKPCGRLLFYGAKMTAIYRLIFLYIVFAGGLIGCAAVEPAVVAEEPNLSFSGTFASGNITGERSVQVLSEIEAKLLQVFPRAKLLLKNSNQADVYLDVNVYSARIIDTRSSQELRNCRRWSEPAKDAQGTFKKLISRQCLDWQVQNLPCLARKYELDVSFQARQRADGSVIASERKVFEDQDRQCGDKSPATAKLQAGAESKAASWANNLLRLPVTSFASNKFVPQQVPSSLPILQGLSNQSQSAQLVPPPIATSLPILQGPSILLPSAASVTQSVTLAVVAHALVIGNGSYAGSSKLINPTNDAKAISVKLRSLGFTVTELLDTDRRKLVATLSQFSKSAANADITLLFYAGHGVQIMGTNYMLPVDLNLNDLTQAPLDGISLNDVVSQYLPGKTKLVFLDACRDNPLMQVASRSVSRGLAPINVSEGTLISYATKDGQVAQDGDGKNSPFTSALLEHLSDPDDIAVVLRKVREKVMRATGGKQQPWEYGSLTGGELVLAKIKGGQ